MAGMFNNPRITSLLVVFLALAAIQRTDGYPYQWPKIFSHGNVNAPVPGKLSSNERDLVTSISKDYAREIAPSGESVHYLETSLTYKGENEESPVVHGSREEQKSDFDDDEDSGDANDDDIEEAEKDDEDDNDTNVRGENTDDQITRLIEQALEDDVFLTPEKWAETLADKPFDIPYDEGMSVKIQKPRSPGDPPSLVTAQTGHSSTNDRIVFPDDAPKRKSDDVIRRPVPSCKNTTFCLNPPYYPSNNDVETALKMRFLDPVTEPPSISGRIGPTEDDNGLCISREQVIQPKTALDDNNEWRYILNNDKYVQTVRVEICQTRDGACRIIDDIASGYKTSCKQKYIYRQLVALGPNGTASIPFQIPSSCCCHVKFTGDSLMRIGARPKKPKQQSPVSNGNED